MKDIKESLLARLHELRQSADKMLDDIKFESSIGSDDISTKTNSSEGPNTIMLEMTYKSIQEVESALDRLASGCYGICELCGKPISKARMKIVPNAIYCVTCQASNEKN